MAQHFRLSATAHQLSVDNLPINTNLTQINKQTYLSTPTNGIAQE